MANALIVTIGTALLSALLVYEAAGSVVWTGVTFGVALGVCAGSYVAGYRHERRRLDRP